MGRCHEVFLARCTPGKSRVTANWRGNTASTGRDNVTNAYKPARPMGDKSLNSRPDINKYTLANRSRNELLGGEKNI